MSKRSKIATALAVTAGIAVGAVVAYFAWPLILGAVAGYAGATAAGVAFGAGWVSTSTLAGAGALTALAGAVGGIAAAGVAYVGTALGMSKKSQVKPDPTHERDPNSRVTEARALGKVDPEKVNDHTAQAQMTHTQQQTASYRTTPSQPDLFDVVQNVMKSARVTANQKVFNKSDFNAGGNAAIETLQNQPEGSFIICKGSVDNTVTIALKQNGGISRERFTMADITTNGALSDRIKELSNANLSLQQTTSATPAQPDNRGNFGAGGRAAHMDVVPDSAIQAATRSTTSQQTARGNGGWGNHRQTQAPDATPQQVADARQQVASTREDTNSPKANTSITRRNS